MILYHRLDLNKDADMQYLIEKFGVRYYSYFMFLLEYFISEGNEEFTLDTYVDVFKLSKILYLENNDDLYFVLNTIDELGYLESNTSPIAKGSTIKLPDNTYKYFQCSSYDEEYDNDY